jgi:hypothetical protein
MKVWDMEHRFKLHEEVLFKQDKTNSVLSGAT